MFYVLLNDNKCHQKSHVTLWITTSINIHSSIHCTALPWDAVHVQLPPF